MKFELYREDHLGIDRKPFAVVETASEAEREASAEILEGDASAVVVRSERHEYLGTITVPYTMPECPQCGSEVENIGAGAVCWFFEGSGEDDRLFCSQECLAEAVLKPKRWVNAFGNGFNLRQTRVGMDVFERPLEALIVADESWNGFAIPFMTKAQADEWLEAQQRVFAGDDEAGAYYDAERDEYGVKFADDLGEPRIFSGADWTNPEGQTVRLYCIGGWDWTWDEE